MHSTFKTFGVVAMLEGISYILLLAIAMPLKYFFDLPLAVRIVGWAHGVLFVAYGLFLVLCWVKYQWSFRRVFIYFIASLLPLLPFWVERDVKREFAAS